MVKSLLVGIALRPMLVSTAQISCCPVGCLLAWWALVWHAKASTPLTLDRMCTSGPRAGGNVPSGLCDIPGTTRRRARSQPAATDISLNVRSSFRCFSPTARSMLYVSTDRRHSIQYHYVPGCIGFDGSNDLILFAPSILRGHHLRSNPCGTTATGELILHHPAESHPPCTADTHQSHRSCKRCFSPNRSHS